MHSKVLCTIFIILLAVSCAKKPPKVVSVEGMRNSRAVSVEKTLKEADAQIASIRGLGKASIVDNGNERLTDIVILVKRPEQMRMDAMDALADVWAAAGTDGIRMWLWLPQKAKLYRGTASKRNLKKLAEFDLELSEMASIISGLVPGIQDATLVEINRKERHYRFEYKPLHLFMDKKRKYPVKIIRYQPTGSGTDEREEEGQVQYEVRYSDWASKNSIRFPGKIEVMFPKHASSFSMIFKEIEFNKDLDDSIFKPGTVWRAKTVNIR